MKRISLFVLCAAFALPITFCAFAEDASKPRFTINKIELSMNDNSNFSGRAIFYPPQKRAIFEIINKSKMPFDFKDALFYVVTSPPNKAVYQFEFDKIYYKQHQRADMVSNPEDIIAIQCVVPNNIVYVSGAYIKLTNGNKIYFEYEELTAWQRFYKNLLNSMGLGKGQKVFKEEEGWKTGGVTPSGNRYRYKEVDKEEKDWWEIFEKTN